MTSFAEDSSRFTADGLLAIAHLSGDDDGFTTLYRRYHPDVLRYVRASVRDQVLAEDLAQEAMARALRYLHSYDPRQPFWPWIRKIAQTVVATELGRRSAEVPVESVEGAQVCTLPDATDAVVSREAVAECLRQLPKRQRRALVMRYVEDRDANDIALLFGISRNAFEQLLLRSRNNFRDEYRARNTGIFGPLAGWITTRLRRVSTAFETRWHAATNSAISVAGDMALGVAVTVGTLAFVQGLDGPGPRGSSPMERDGGRSLTSPPGDAAARAGGAYAAAPRPGAIPVGATTVTSDQLRPESPRAAALNGSGQRYVVPLPGHPGPAAPDDGPDQPGTGTAPGADQPGTGSGTAPDQPGTGGEVAGADTTLAEPAAPTPTGSPGVATADGGTPTGPAPEPTPSPTPTPTPTPSPAADDEQGTGAPMVGSEALVEPPLPTSTAGRGDEETYVRFENDRVAEASSETAVKNDPTDAGEAVNQQIEAEAAGLTTSPEIYVENEEDDGTTCMLLHVCPL